MLLKAAELFDKTWKFSAVPSLHILGGGNVHFLKRIMKRNNSVFMTLCEGHVLFFKI